MWQQNASSWSDALLQQHPLYRDVLQPVALAVYEVRCGLSLMLEAADSRVDYQLAESALADCMAFPGSLNQGESAQEIGLLWAAVTLPVTLESQIEECQPVR